MKRLYPYAAVALLVSSAAPLDPAGASPFSPAGLDAQIVDCMQQIDADSLQSYIAVMQGFTNRHTNSDTLSTTTGIGAARRWVFEKFQEFANQGGNLDVSYHDFTALVSGVVGDHRNVVAEIPGTVTGPERRIYVIGGHLDSRNEDVDDSLGTSYGADDNASGVACVLECARVLSKESWPMTFRFLAFSGEEQGLLGSGVYADEQALLGEPIAAMIANDVMSSIIGAPHPDSTATTDTTLARVFAGVPAEGPHRQLQRYLKAMGDVYVPIQDIVIIPAEDRPGRGSDHISFADAGFPAVRYMEYLEELDRQHTTLGDTLGAHLSMSYTRRNAQVDIATLGSLALSPASPGGLAVGNIGDSTGFHLSWPTTNPEGDLDGYLVTMRHPSSVDYDSVIDVGMVNAHTIATAPSESVYFGLSVKNTAGHQALVANEVLGVLSSTPFAPTGLAALPKPSSILLTWTPSPEVDLVGYHVYRSDTPGSGYAALTTTPLASPTLDDETATPGILQYYVVTAVDSKARESAFSVEVASRVATLDAGVLFVDETKNGATIWFPPEATADAVYASQLDTLAVAVWDRDVDGLPTLADLAEYSSVIWVSDDFNQEFQGQPIVQQHLFGAEEQLRDYLDLGGNLMLVGWEATAGLKRPLEYPIDLEPGDFLHDYFGLDVVGHEMGSELVRPLGVGPFPTLDFDPDRMRPNWNGGLIRGEYFTSLQGDAEILYRYDSDEPAGPFHLQPNGVRREGGAYRTVYWGFPLYHLDDADAHQALIAVYQFFGEFPGATSAPAVTSLEHWALSRSHPNPFTRETEIRFVVPGDAAELDLSVYDLAGRRVRKLASGIVPGGLHSRTWDGRNDDGRQVAAGVYFYRLSAPERTLTRKLVLLR